MKKVAFISGAIGGIGQAVSENFIKQDYQVILIDSSKEKLRTFSNKIIQTS